eukprot:TRINITY_DN13389_c0_g1_i4.p1 TRINITY_DN13389_c0_g1~~TRINITY_DN13389_c0_g1_i4.p1  ORF type:complete len:137 (-),score=28.13 TRINITY_DN13389_c0_g1_i4:176-586(-)
MADGGDAMDTEIVQRDPQGSLKIVLKKALVHDGIVRGLRECVRALDRQEAQLCVLATDCEEKDYVALITALAKEHKIPLIEVPQRQLLGEWAGLYKLDTSSNPRKIVKTSCVVVKSFGETSPELEYLLTWMNSNRQ